MNGTLVVRESQGLQATVERDGPFSLGANFAQGMTYSVGILRQPLGQDCVVSRGEGTVAGDVTDVAIECRARRYPITVRVSQVAGTVTLASSPGGTMSVSVAGSFTFPDPVPYGQPFAVATPAAAGQSCLLANATGLAAGQPIEVEVRCLATGSTAGLPGGWRLGGRAGGLGVGAVAIRNDADGFTTTLVADGPFVFPRTAANGAGYAFSVADQSPGLSCSIANARGTATADVDDIVVSCVPAAIAPVAPVAPGVPQHLSVSYAVKSYAFRWSATAGTTHYELFEDPDGGGPLPATQLGGSLPGTGYTVTHAVALYERLNAQYTVRACNGSACGAVTAALQPSVRDAIGYFKASNTDPNDQFGSGLALSGDGNTLAVASPFERSNATTINGNQADNSLASGAVYVFARSGGTWAQQAYVKTAFAKGLGYLAMSLSADGNTLAVGSYAERSAAVGIGGVQGDNGVTQSGAAYVFTRSGTVWTQQAYFKASNAEAGDLFGYWLAVSGDGNTLAVGALYEASGSPGVGANQLDNSAPRAGAVYVFRRTGTSWSQEAYIKASNAEAFDYFGGRVSLSFTGDTLAVSAVWEDSAATGVNGAQLSNAATESGAVYVFQRTGTVWAQQAYLKASNTETNDQFGISIGLSADGNTLAVGAYLEDSAAVGINGDQSSNAASNSGAVYVFVRAGAAWTQQAYIKAGNAKASAQFGGFMLALSADGNKLAVAAVSESSAASGIDNGQADTSASLAGAVYVFSRAGTSWSQSAYLKASNTAAGDQFGHMVTMSADGSTIAVGAPREDSNAVGVGGDQGNNLSIDSGAVYLY